MGMQVSDEPNHASGHALAVTAVKAITELVTIPGIGCIDFADVTSGMSGKRVARTAVGWSVGENRAKEAAAIALASLSRQGVHLLDARGILINIAAGLDLGIGEFDEVGIAVEEHCSETAVVVLGTTLDPDMEGMHVTIIAAGLDQAIESL